MTTCAPATGHFPPSNGHLMFLEGQVTAYETAIAALTPSCGQVHDKLLALMYGVVAARAELLAGSLENRNQ